VLFDRYEMVRPMTGQRRAIDVIANQNRGEELWLACLTLLTQEVFGIISPRFAGLGFNQARVAKKLAPVN
jgi:hypothetical protein